MRRNGLNPQGLFALHPRCGKSRADVDRRIIQKLPVRPRLNCVHYPFLVPALPAWDDAALAVIRLLQERGYTADDVNAAYETLQPVPATKTRQRQARRLGLDMRVRTEAAQILGQRGINPEGHELDRQRLERSNLIVMKAALDRHLNDGSGEGFRMPACCSHPRAL